MMTKQRSRPHLCRHFPRLLQQAVQKKSKGQTFHFRRSANQRKCISFISFVEFQINLFSKQYLGIKLKITIQLGLVTQPIKQLIRQSLRRQRNQLLLTVRR